MSDTQWPRYSGKRLDFSILKGLGSGEYLVAAGLGLVIILAGGMAIHQLSRGPGDSAATLMHYKCEQCGHEFTVEVPDAPVARAPGDAAGLFKRDCTNPHCGAKNSCWPTVECPDCHKWFIGQTTEAQLLSLRTGQRMDPNVHDVCPYCKTDAQEWHKQHQGE